MVKKFKDSLKSSDSDDIIHNSDDIIHNSDTTESYKDNSFSETKLSKKLYNKEHNKENNDLNSLLSDIYIKSKKKKHHKHKVNVYSTECNDDTFIKPFNFNLIKGERGHIGPQGIMGPRGKKGKRGKKGDSGHSIVWKGYWLQEIIYQINDIVSYNGSVYISINCNSNIVPSSEYHNWALMLQKCDCIEWKGIWNETVLYMNYNLVFYNGSTYICILSNINNNPNNNIIYWNLFAQGSAGPTGPVGPTGPADPTDTDE